MAEFSLTRRVLVAAAGSTLVPSAADAAMADDRLRWRGFRPLRQTAGDVAFSGQVGGSGPPLLLLHGYPETHIAWRDVAPELARSYTVIAPDLPGYGDSGIVAVGGPRWDKRRVGKALVALMTALGHARFLLVAHDRGARAGYRLALDHPRAVAAFSSLTVLPILDVWPGVNENYALKNFHWFMFAQPDPIPEKLLSGAPDAFIDFEFHNMTNGKNFLEPVILERYRAAFRRPSVRHYMCEDYRAAPVEDTAADRADREAGRKMPCPVQILWSRQEVAPNGPTPIDVWRRWATDVTGQPFDAGHLLAEERPREILAALQPFLAGSRDKVRT